MHDLIVEEGSFGANPSTKDLTRHLFTRMSCGKVVIISDKSLLSALRKQWLRLIRKVQRERSSTLDTIRIFELTNILMRMHSLRFTTQYPPDDYPGDVYIVNPEQALEWAPDCRTMYITCPIKQETIHTITAWMPKGSLVVLYPQVTKNGGARPKQ
jgi:hypothetical protein